MPHNLFSRPLIYGSPAPAQPSPQPPCGDPRPPPSPHNVRAANTPAQTPAPAPSGRRARPLPTPPPRNPTPPSCMILSITSSLCPTPLIAVIIPSASSSIFWNCSFPLTFSAQPPEPGQPPLYLPRPLLDIPVRPRPQTLRHPPTPYPVRHHWASSTHSYSTNGRGAPSIGAAPGAASSGRDRHLKTVVEAPADGSRRCGRACSANHSVVALPGGSAGPMRSSTARCEAVR